jgi:uncharacterized protein (DUF58 family)
MRASETGTTTAAAQRSDSFIDPQVLMRIKNLEFRARVVVQGFWNGLHRSPYHGFSVEFTEYRQYTPGDDPRYVDWKLFARSDRYYVKKFEDETNLRCQLLVDCSKSMGYGSLAYTKSDYANTLAASLGYFLFEQGDAVGVLTFDEAVRDYLPARNRPGHLRQLMLALDKAGAGTTTDLIAPLKRAAEITRRRGLMVLISDLLAPVDRLETSLGTLAASGHEVLLFHVLDPAEVTFSFDKASLFYDVESARELYIDPALARRDYLRQFTAHTAGVEATCRKLGVAYHRLATDQPLEGAVFDFLRARMQRSKLVKRGRNR